ncbi:Kinase domain protein [Aphelenchoides bicaudatus]|nr:Kinase domain protein [Aphelenchoides bicaudatus]
MPLGFFGSNSNNGPKPQTLKSEKDKTYKDVATTSAATEIKDCKGSTVKLGKKSYVVEKKLAEGAYGIVYLVSDKKNRLYALKRQLIRDDARQIEACKTEAQIVKNLHHPNIVNYVDHSLTVNKSGIYDHLLLTVYYKSNVLQLLNERLMSNRWLSVDEILAIFCDLCEAIARLHHSKTPVIHRDLKVENILIDERSGTERPVYVLCDFGSATTKIMSRETHTQSQLEDEIKKYTTLSYRAPEMIDLFSNIPIDTKSDIWALGVLLFKLCYFTLPFGESAMAIQNGNFTFPETPEIPEEIKAIINLCLTASSKHRLNIYQTSYLAFSAAKRKCPVYNIEKCFRIELTEAIEILRLKSKLGANYARRLEKALNDFEDLKNKEKIEASKAPPPPLNTKSIDQPSTAQAAKSPTVPPQTPLDFRPRDPSLNISMQSQEGMIVNTGDERRSTLTTTINPRLRPKASSNASGILPPPVTASPRMPAKYSDSYSTDVATKPNMVSTSAISGTMFSSNYSEVSQISTDSTKSAPLTTEASNQHTASSAFVPAKTTPSSTLKTSAFQPYSTKKQNDANNSSYALKAASVDVVNNFESFNPFISRSSNMNDSDFGEKFDEMRRVNRRNTIETTTSTAPLACSGTSEHFKIDPILEQTIDEDPFFNAPIHPNQIMTPNTINKI